MKESEILNNIIYHYNQHPERTKQPSELVDAVEKVMNCDREEALKLASKHCNSISTYAVLYALGKISNTYEDFFRWGIQSGAINKYGFIDWNETRFLKALCTNTDVVKILPPFLNLKETVYKMKINNDYGTHFMGAYYTNGNLFISDPNSRGVGVTVASLKDGDKIEYLKEYI